ncbi:MAG: hypothetical protein IT203_01355 [Fimbriimonadaceae bacterium]|nr:hypothetical protein [Fimbriimonadaceae bacterium]
MFRPFLVRSLIPVSSVEGKRLRAVHRLGKRIVLEFEGDSYLVVHLMIAGRFLWGPKPVVKPGKVDLACFEFESGCLLLTEAGTKRRASLHVVQGAADLKEHDRGGVDPTECSEEEFAAIVRRENRTLKRLLTNPANFSGIGNAYSDEILFEARLSPVRLSQALKDDEVHRLWQSARSVLLHWTSVLREEFKFKFPGRGQITAFREDFNVHGQFGEPCRICGMPIQRIVHAENETNYCARCQNEDRLLADRALSKLLKSDWPRTIEEMVGD